VSEKTPLAGPRNTPLWEEARELAGWHGKRGPLDLSCDTAGEGYPLNARKTGSIGVGVDIGVAGQNTGHTPSTLGAM
jgi:hypothetical protein